MNDRKQLAKTGLTGVVVFIISMVIVGTSDTDSILLYIGSITFIGSMIAVGVSLYKLNVMKNKVALICLVLLLNIIYILYAGIFILLPIYKEENTEQQ